MDDKETLGYLRGKVETLDREVSLIRLDVSAIRGKLDEQKGGWKVLASLLAVSAAVGSLVTATVEWMTRK